MRERRRTERGRPEVPSFPSLIYLYSRRPSARAEGGLERHQLVYILAERERQWKRTGPCGHLPLPWPTKRPSAGSSVRSAFDSSSKVARRIVVAIMTSQ